MRPSVEQKSNVLGNGRHGGWKMRLRERERWRCTNPDCRSEIVVTKTARLEGGTNPRCSCGAAMKKPYQSPALTTIADGEGCEGDVFKGREER